MSTITAILPVYNGGRYLQESLRSVMSQTVLPDELIVVDDGSTDDSLSRLEAMVPAPFPVRILKQTNRGQSAARNVAAKESHGDYLAFLDQDDRWYPRHLEVLAAALDANGEAGWAYSDFDEMDGEGNVVTSTLR